MVIRIPIEKMEIFLFGEQAYKDGDLVDSNMSSKQLTEWTGKERLIVRASDGPEGIVGHMEILDPSLSDKIRYRFHAKR